jgi:hypothetical protein
VLATANDGSGIRDSLTVSIDHQIIPVSSIQISGENGDTTIDRDGGSLQMLAWVLPADATDTTLAWTVTNVTGRATISGSGLLQADSNGTVWVVATAKDGSGVQDSLLITISQPVIRVSSISLTPEGDTATIDRDNGTLQIHALILPVNATDTTLTWTVRNGTGKASISATGLLNAIANGTVTVVATAHDGSGVSDSLEVTISGQTTGVYELPGPYWTVITEPERDLLRIGRKDPSTEKCTVRIFNMMGQLSYLSQFTGSRHVVDLSSLPTGYYILHLKGTRSILTSYKFHVK